MTKNSVYFVFICSIITSLICMSVCAGLLPWLRINWFLTVFLYWASYYPQHIGVFWALTLGILFDLFTGSLVGSMSISMILMVSCLHVLRPPLTFFKPLQQILIIFLILGSGLLLHFWIQLFVGKPMIASFYAYTVIYTALAWPIISFGLKQLVRVKH